MDGWRYRCRFRRESSDDFTRSLDRLSTDRDKKPQSQHYAISPRNGSIATISSAGCLGLIKEARRENAKGIERIKSIKFTARQRDYWLTDVKRRRSAMMGMRAEKGNIAR